MAHARLARCPRASPSRPRLPSRRAGTGAPCQLRLPLAPAHAPFALPPPRPQEPGRGRGVCGQRPPHHHLLRQQEAALLQPQRERGAAAPCSTCIAGGAACGWAGSCCARASRAPAHACAVRSATSLLQVGNAAPSTPPPSPTRARLLTPAHTCSHLLGRALLAPPPPQVGHMAPFNTAAFPDSLALGKADALLIGAIDEIQARGAPACSAASPAYCAVLHCWLAWRWAHRHRRQDPGEQAWCVAAACSWLESARLRAAPHSVSARPPPAARRSCTSARCRWASSRGASRTRTPPAPLR